MSHLGRICAIGSLWLVTAVSILSVANASDTQVADVTAVTPQSSPSAQQQEAAPAAQPGGGNPLWEISLEQLSATRDRPLFSPSRRPPVADAPVNAAVDPPVQAPRAPERPQLSLVGTVVNGDDGFAIFVDQTKASLRIRMGADYHGWMLRRIEARSVTLEKDREVAVLAFAPASDHNSAAGAELTQTRPDLPAPAQPAPSTARAAPPYLSPESNAIQRPVRSRSARRH